MLPFFDPLRQFSFWSVVFRLLLAILCGGIVGYGRSARNSAASFHTYMLVSLGAALSVMITLYEYTMLQTAWADVVGQVGEKFDASRMAAQVVSGIGFLGVGTILIVAHRKVRGLTTATGMFATACMSVAAGAGFYECVLTVALLGALVLNVMVPLEVSLRRRHGNITLAVEMGDVSDIDRVASVIEAEHARVYEVDVDRTGSPASASFVVRLDRANGSYSAMLSSVAGLPCVHSVQDLFS